MQSFVFAHQRDPRIRILTSGDWSVIRISGARLTNPVRVAVREEPIAAAFDGRVFGLSQAIEAAQAGKMISMTWEVAVESVTNASMLTVEIESSAIGTTTVILENALGSEPMPVRAIRWSGGTVGGFQSSRAGRRPSFSNERPEVFGDHAPGRSRRPSWE
jgi:hypothetical protein